MRCHHVRCIQPGFTCKLPTWKIILKKKKMLSEDVDDEIVLPGLVGLGNEARQGPGVPLRRIQLGVGLESSNTNQEEEIASDDEEVCCWIDPYDTLVYTQ